MTDGPYREPRELVPHERHEIVRADEPPPPSLRLRATDYSDGTTLIELHGSNPALSGLVSGALTLCLLPIVVSAWAHGDLVRSCLTAAVAAWSGGRALRSGRAIEEIAVGRNGIAFRGRSRRDVVLIEDVRGIDVEATGDDELFVALHHGAASLKLLERTHREPRMERPEVEWLRDRLRRALERARRQP